METAVTTAIATVIAAAIAGLAAWATSRSAAKAQVSAQTTASRTQMEEGAFERAKGFYTDTIDRQAAQIEGLETDVAALQRRVAELEGELKSTKNQLDTAQAALRIRYPDED